MDKDEKFEVSKLGHLYRAGCEMLTMDINKPFSYSMWVLRDYEVDFFAKYGFKLVKSQWHNYSELIRPLPAPFTHIIIRLSKDDISQFIGELMVEVEQINTYRNVFTNVKDAYSVRGNKLIPLAKEIIKLAIDKIKEYNANVMRELEKELEDEDESTKEPS